MSIGGSHKYIVAVAMAAVVGALIWAASTLTTFSFDPRVAAVKSATVKLLLAEEKIGVVSPEVAANLTVPGLPKSQQSKRIRGYLASSEREFQIIFTPARARWYSHLQARGLKLWLKEKRTAVVTNTHLQVHYWQQVTLTSFGAWVKVRGQFVHDVNGRRVSKAPATFFLRLVGNQASGYRISNEKWLGYNPS
jgi:hypothetical protein